MTQETHQHNGQDSLPISFKDLVESQISDLTHGDILYVNSNKKLINLGAGTSGQFLKTQGSGANPAWASVGKFGVTGISDAGNDALLPAISSGNQNIDCLGQAIRVFNLTSLSITGTGSTTFTNPHANGTLVMLLVSGNVTITSSATRAIDARSIGAAGGTGTNGNGNNGTGALELYDSSVHYGAGGVQTGGTNPGGAGGAIITPQGLYTTTLGKLYLKKSIFMFVGSGGGGGAGSTTAGGVGGNGGSGGGGLYIECAGSINFTGTIDVGGNNGATTATAGNGSGGGGGGGSCIILYNSASATSGTVSINGGTGGTLTTFGGGAGGSGGGGGGSYSGAGTAGGAAGTGSGNPNVGDGGAGGTGANGFSLVTANTVFL